MTGKPLGELASEFINVRYQKGTLKLVALTDRVRKMFEVTKLVQLIDVFDDEAEALQSF